MGASEAPLSMPRSVENEAQTTGFQCYVIEGDTIRKENRSLKGSTNSGKNAD